MTTLVEAGTYMTTANPNYTDSGNGMPSLDRSPPTLLHGTPAESNMVRNTPANNATETGTGTSEDKIEAQHISTEQSQGLKTKDNGALSLHRDESPGEKKWPYTPPQQDASSPWAQPSASQQPAGSTAQHEPEFPFGRNDSLIDTNAAQLDQSGAATDASEPKTSQIEAAQLSTKLSEPALSQPQPIGAVTNVSGAMNIYMQAHSSASGQPGGAAGLLVSPHDASLPASCSTAASQTPSGTPPPNVFMNGAAHFQPQRPVNPVLYSAIGSLEVNANGSFNHKIMLSQNQKSKANAQRQTNQMSLYDDQNTGISVSTLIPPASTQLHQVHHTMPYQAQPVTKPLPQDGSPNKINTVLYPPQPHELNKTNERKYDDNTSGTGTKKNSSVKVEPAIKNVTKEQKSATQPKIRSSLAAAASGGGLQQQTSLKKSDKRRNNSKRVTIDTTASVFPEPNQQEEMFRPFGDAYTPRMDRKKIDYKPPQMRTPVQKMSSTMGTISRPNFRDALRRVAMIIQQHIIKIERRFEKVKGQDDKGLFLPSMKEAFCEDKFATPRYKCSMPRVPMARPGLVCAQRQIRVKYTIPTSNEIYEFAHQLFKAVQLSSECSIVCLIYVERLMEMGKVPLLASTWRPIFMCGLLLASKVWQDLSSWNIEFAIVYPQFSVDAINRLEQLFLSKVKWELYISSSLYAKYYFALRSLLEKQDFRNRYNRMVGGVGSVNASEALQIQKRTQAVKEEVISQLSRSM